jgi:IS30 family transposase
MNLDDQIANFLADADADARPARSKLEPYAELIRELRQRRWTFREIADALRERFAVTASPSTIHDFAKVRAQRARAETHRTQPEHPQPGTAAPVSSKPPRFHVKM